MIRTREILALLLVGVVGVVSACNADTPTPSASLAVAEATASPTEASSPSQSASLSPDLTPSPKPTPAPPATPQPTPAAAPTATPLPTPAPTPVPWNSYKSKRNQYRIQYPPTWVVTPGSAKLADQFDGFGYPVVYVSRDTVSGRLSVSLSVTHAVAYDKSHYKAKLLSNKPIKLAGWSGRLVTLKGVIDGRKVLIQEIILGKGRVAYFLDMFGDLDQAVPDKALFKKIYKTWRPT